MTNTESTVAFESVEKLYRRGVERANLRAALPGRLGRSGGTGGYQALASVSFEVFASEIVGIIGPNGAGKSTTLKLIARVIAPTHGRVVTRGRIASLIELGVGFHPDLTGTENVRFSAAVLGMSKADVRARYDSIVEFAGIEAFMGTPVKRYSSGMLARLGFAVASHLDADIILVDEVLAVGDAAFQRRSFQRMRELRSSGATLLLVTHNLWLVPEICQRALRLENGSIADEGAPREVVDRYIASAAASRAAQGHEGAPSARIFGLRLSKTAIHPGEGISVEIDLEVSRAMEDCRLTLVFVTPAGMHAAGFDVDGSAAAFERAGRWQVRGEIPGLWLVPDQYRATVTVLQQVGDIPLTVDQVVGQLTVIGDDRPQYGFAHLAGQWTVAASKDPL